MKLTFLLTFFATLVSYFKFRHCIGSNWATPDQYIHACYSDIPALFGERGLSTGAWSYASGSNSVEYPVLTGTIMWLLAKLTFGSGAVGYFYINAVFIAGLFISLGFLIQRMKPELAYLYALAPAAVASLYINWDLWAIISMVAAIYWFDRKKFDYSALALGISVATKFMPIFLLLPVIYLFWHQRSYKALARYLAIFTSVVVLINLPFALTTPTGWWRFYELNLNRSSDWGSIWYSLSALGINLSNINYLSILLLLIGFAALAIYLLELSKVPELAEISFIVLAVVMTASKVYSPQYVLWLVPLAVLALNNKKDVYAFWVWQGAEMIYHLAIWQHLAVVTDAKFGLPADLYALISLARMAALGFFISVLVRRGLSTSRRASNSHKTLREFLFESADKYP
ncbi:unannotated protein [freshwater metagenome]|uniref:Unannotated protein n=1 Tax=freshwater metagenome TaxID=449393 RepID=A0A6J7DYL2_9ZZZZ|nr:mannosyltransferase [Actinomycetota bacterium]